MATPAPLGLPLDEATYATPGAVKAALQSHARDNGYGVSVSSSKDQRIYYACAKGENFSTKMSLQKKCFIFYIRTLSILHLVFAHFNVYS
jgi:hypothetical protein